MVHSIFQLTEWLENHKGQTLIINKEEYLPGNPQPIDDDHVKLHLDNISVRNIEHQDEDDYLANQEVILHGKGQITSDQGDVDIPQNVYEIPLFGNVAAEHQGNGMVVETEKATYTIYSE